MADHPVAVVHTSHNPEDTLGTAVGTGPYKPESLEVGVKGVIQAEKGRIGGDMQRAKAPISTVSNLLTTELIHLLGQLLPKLRKLMSFKKQLGHA